MDYYISDQQSLERVQNEKSLKNSIRKIKITPLYGQDHELLERQLNKSYFACGCQEGAIATVLSVIVIFLIWLLYDFDIKSKWWLILTLILASALLGKFIGLIVNHIRLKRIFKNLHPYYNDPGKI